MVYLVWVDTSSHYVAFSKSLAIVAGFDTNSVDRRRIYRIQ